MQTRELVAKLISINSAFPSDIPTIDRLGEEELATFIEQILRGLGFVVKRQYIGKHFNILAEKGQGLQALLLSGQYRSCCSGVENKSLGTARRRRQALRPWGI